MCSLLLRRPGGGGGASFELLRVVLDWTFMITGVCDCVMITVVIVWPWHVMRNEKCGRNADHLHRQSIICICVCTR